MMIPKDDAREVIGLIRRARERYARVAGNAQCEKSKMIFLSLDVAELQVADEVTNEYQEPRLLVTLRNLVRAFGLWKETLIDRVEGHPDSLDVFSR